MNDYEISRLKRQLQRKNEQLKEQRQDRQRIEKQLIETRADRDKYYGQLLIARNTIENIDSIIGQNVKQIKLKLENDNAEALKQLQKYKDEVNEVKRVNDKYLQQVKQKQIVISDLSMKLREVARKYKDPSLIVNTKQVSDYVAINQNQLQKMTQKYSKLCQDMQNILAENKILRKLHGVPDNFGFDLEEIKIAQKQQLQDYKTQCRKLETQIQQLEAQRTQLRYRLRQYNTLYSNKGERYKDLNNRQLQLLDRYAIILKQGRQELPQIDKSHREMEKEILKLRTQVQTLQAKGLMIPRSPVNNQGQRLGPDVLRRLQQQIRSTLEPFVQDIRKLNQNNLNSIIHSLQSANQGQIDLINKDSLIRNQPMESNFRPPIPLPQQHNNWSQIKEGYSYAFASKIPIERKDCESDLGFDVISAKYQIAALQLQNIESLKLLKQKNKIEKQLAEQLQILKNKYKKCLKVQDDLFMRYFKEKEQVRDKIKILEIDRNNILAERDQFKAKHDILNQTFRSLNQEKKIDPKLNDYMTRLSISEAEVIKLTRKYNTIYEEQKSLRQAYTKLQSKSAQSQFNLKEKLLRVRKNQKQLTSLLNQIIFQAKESISLNTHNVVLARNQSLNDKAANFAFKQAQLRLKINRLQSIERQMNIKDEIIQNLRQASLDLNLELEILRNRLQLADPTYRSYREIFRRIISYINSNNISLANYFKKFDRNNTGNLDKTELQTAFNTLGFKLSNTEMEIFFSQFDLDGSGSITYKQFISKLKRGGVLTRSKEQQAIYKLYKAIKQSNISVKKAFQMIDIDGSNAISKTEFESAMRKIGIEVSSETVNHIFKLGDSDMDGTITCNELEKIFNDIVKQTMIQEKEISIAQLDWKYLVILKMQQCSQKFKIQLKKTFTSLDKDGNQYLTISQLSSFFTKSGIQLPKNQLIQLFDFLDRHKDGKVQYSEFLKILAEAKKQKKKTDRIKYIEKRSQQIRRQNEMNLKEVQKHKITQQVSLKVRLMALQTKQNSLITKNQKLIKNLINKQQQIYDLQKSIQQTQKQINKIQTQYYKQKETNIILEQKMKNYIGFEKAKLLEGNINKIKIDNLEFKTNLQMYKGLYQSLTDKNKAQQLKFGKLQSQLNKYYDIVKQLQSNDDLNSKLARLTIEIQHSKYNEEIVNKKYDAVIEDMRKIAQENLKMSEQSAEKEVQFVNIHVFMKQKYNMQQRTIDDLSSQVYPTASFSRIQQFIMKLRQISIAKTELQLQNQALRDKNFSLELRNDYIQNEKVHLQELQRKLRRTYTDESSIAIIDLTKKLSEYKMLELKSKRQGNLLRQKQQYYMRVNNAHVENIKELEKQLSEWEKKYNQRQQFWRESINSKVKMMEDLQNEVSKAKQQEKKAVLFFQERNNQVNSLQKQYSQMGEARRSNISHLFKNNNQDAIETKLQLTELRNQLLQKQKQIIKLKATLNEIIPESSIKFTDFGGQFNQPTNSFVMQTELTSSQLKNNARRFINNQKQNEIFYKQQAQRLTQAAQQSIDTLQKIIDDKNQQLKRKQKIIDDLRRQFMKNKEDDCVEIQKLHEEIRQIKQKKQISSLNQIMNKSTKGNFYNNKIDDKINGLIKIIQEKDQQIRILKQKLDQAYINKNKGSSIQAARKMLEKNIKQLQEEIKNQQRKNAENETKSNQKIRKLERQLKAKDQKYVGLQNALKKIKDDIVYEKNSMKEPNLEDIESHIQNMNRGSNVNESKMQIMLKKAMQTIQQMTKKNKQYETQIKKLKEQTKVNRTMPRK